jgi:colanic acid/amylovoran biosynthesis glycosyltransferase
LTTVIHSFPFWLPQTQTWMYNQVKFLPEDVTCHVVCERTENLDQFAVPYIHALRERSLARYLWDKGLVKLRLRRHSGFLLERIRTLRADIVHSHFGHYAWRDMHACGKEGSAQVATFYGLDVNYVPAAFPQWRRRYLQLFDRVDRVLCEGPHMASCVVGLAVPSTRWESITWASRWTISRSSPGPGTGRALFASCWPARSGRRRGFPTP